MPTRNVDTAIRVAHDLTQSVWLGGALMGATALDTAAARLPDQRDRVEAIGEAWSRWQRVSTPTIALHMLAGVGLTYANKGRLAAQRGGGRTTAVRTALTGLALGTELTSRFLGASVASEVARGGEARSLQDGGEDRTQARQRQLKLAQWANVAVLATMVAVGSRMGEQQRPRELARGVASRLGIAA